MPTPNTDNAAFVLSPQQKQQLAEYSKLLQKWGNVHNLTAILDASKIETLHLQDCLAIVPHLAQHLTALKASGNPTPSLLDVGSGAGLPGVVLAISLPQLRVCCLDANAKKAAFVQQVKIVLSLPNLHSAHARVEQWQQFHDKTPNNKNLPSRFDIITSRAFASLPDFVRLARPLLAPDGVFLAMRGKKEEFADAALPSGIQLFHVEQLSVPHLASSRHALWLRDDQNSRAAAANLPDT